MKNESGLRLLLVFFFTSSIFLHACSSFLENVPREPLDSGEIEARDLLEAIGGVNETLKTFKGIGRVNLSNRRGAIRGARVAWIGTDNGKVRIEVLGISGQPIASLASDGEWLYLYLRAERRFHKKRISGAASLEHLLSIPIKSDDVMAFIAGRVPIREHTHATVTNNHAGNGYVLTLGKRWGRSVEKIYLDGSKKLVQKVEIFNLDGSILFRVILEDMRMIEGYRIPTRLSISDDKGMNTMLTVEKYWANIPVLPPMFELSPPE